MPSRSVAAPAAPVPIGARELGVAAAIAAFAMLVPFHRGLGFPFALDDYTFLMQAAGFDAAAPSLRRWLTVRAYYELWLRVFGPDPLAWHATSFVLHGANALWVHAFARRLGAARPAAWIACGLFAAAPLAFKVLYWAACIQEIASTFFVFAAAWVLGRTDGKRWLAVPLFALAMLCKESVLAAPAVLGLVFGRRALRPCAAMLAVGIAVFLGAGLHGRMFDSSLDLPYATDYGPRLLVNLATHWVWFLSPWRAFPDRLPGPDAQLVLPAVGAAFGLAFAALLARRRGARWIGIAAAWYVALLLPVLPLAQHSYVYYSYLPQVGFLILAGVGLERAAHRVRPGSEPVVAVLGVAAVVGCILLAARNTRTYESLTLPNSLVPYDSVVRYGRAAGSLVRAVRERRLSGQVRRVGFMSFPEQLGRAGQTPTANPNQKGMVRVRRYPLRESLRDGDLMALHFPGLQGAWIDSLTAADEGPDTALFFTSGFDDVEPVEDAVRAYCLQAQGKLLIADNEGARHDLEYALRLDAGDGIARVLLAGLRLQTGDAAGAAELVRDLEPGSVPVEGRQFLKELRTALGLEP